MGRALVVEADGGSRGNPGVGGYGALVRDASDGTLLAERAAPLGKVSNNVAEYEGLIAGLRAALAVDERADIAVRMDSRLVIEQMAGRWKIKHQDMRRLAEVAQELVRALRAAGGSIDWAWIPREKNKAADKLSNDGMDGKRIVRDLWADAAAETGATGPGDEAQEEPAPELAPTPVVKPVARTRLILLRHGVTDFTATGRLDGRGGPDPALNAEGRAQAAAAAAALADAVNGPVTVITSSLRRARETGAAAAAALGVTPVVDDGWDEQSFGEWDGLSYAQIAQLFPDGPTRMRTEDDFGPEAGETHRALAARVDAARERAMAHEGTVVVATHRLPILVVLRSLLGLSLPHAWLLAADPASLTRIDGYDGGRATVASTNDTHHLR